MNLLYSAALRLYFGCVYSASFLGNKKAALWISGRKNLFARLEQQMASVHRKGPVYWFHCASLGEFEQGRPLMEAHREAEPDAMLVLTFFSPSGYEVRKNFAGADVVAYLPLDTASNARKMLDIIRPKRTYFVKYEFWFNLLRELKNRNVETVLVSALFRPSHYFFRWYGRVAARQLQSFSSIFVQDEGSARLLNTIGVKSSVAGDTRFDRVAAVCAAAKYIPMLSSFAQGQKVFVAGSTWLPDEQMIASVKRFGLKLVIVPHEIGEAHLRETERLFKAYKTVRYSVVDSSQAAEAEVLIVDTIGMLSAIYRYASIAYIGGGFGVGIHNVLEPAVYGIPVVFGPKHAKFREALQLIECGGGFSFSKPEELSAIISRLTTDVVHLQAASEASRQYVHHNLGAVRIILDTLR